jgi:DNA-binding NarL/FixJ family response regulator
MPRAEDAYKRLGTCMALAARGATPGERAAAVEAMKRIINGLPAEQKAALDAALLSLVPNTDGTQRQYRPPPRRKSGTKREQIISLLNQGYTPRRIAEMLNMRPNYVYHIKAEMKHNQ